jgi:hypothetical protein
MFFDVLPVFFAPWRLCGEKKLRAFSSIVSLVDKAMPFLVPFFSKQKFQVVLLNTSPLRQFRRHIIIVKIGNDVFRVEMLN